MFFDTHAHYDDRHFDSDRDELLPALFEAGVELIVDPGCDTASSRAALALAEKYPFVYAAVGIHPEEMQDDPCDLGVIRALAQHPKCTAIGEVGLDYYWDREHKAEQQALFRAQLELALALDKPVIVHDRDAHGDCLAIARDYPGARRPRPGRARRLPRDRAGLPRRARRVPLLLRQPGDGGGAARARLAPWL